MKKFHYIDVGCYPIWVGITDEPRVFHKEIRRLGIKERIEFVESDAAGTTHILRSDENNKIAIVCVDVRHLKGKSKSQIMGLLVHEAVHVWQECLITMREKNPGQEVEAYAIQWISQCFMDYIMKPKK